LELSPYSFYMLPNFGRLAIAMDHGFLIAIGQAEPKVSSEGLLTIV
jgi:hypothetical protein